MWAKIKENIGWIVGIFGGLVPLWGGLIVAIQYESNLVKRDDLIKAQKEMQRTLTRKEVLATMERVDILIAFFASRVDELSEKEKNEYEQHKARLINLQEQYDKMVNSKNDEN